jgi:hypothetical protein
VEVQEVEVRQQLKPERSSRVKRKRKLNIRNGDVEMAMLFQVVIL